MRKGEERSSTAGLWVAVVLCGVLGVAGLVLAVGAVVPFVGDAVDVPGRGVGNMFGYLLGMVFFGGIGLAGYKMRPKQPREDGARGTALPFDPTALPPGPGLARRWLAAVPLMLLATALPVFGALVLQAWIGTTRFIPVFDDEPPTFAKEFGEALDFVGPSAIVPAVVLLVFLVRRGSFAAWPKACLWTAVVVTAPTAFLSVMVDMSSATLPNASLAVGLVWLNYWLGRATLWVLSRPVATDLVSSELEIPYFLPGSGVRLRIQRHRLLLDRLETQKSKVHKEIRWSALQSVELTHRDEPTSWEASTRTTIDVPAGLVLHVVAKDDEWLIPVPEILGEDLATAISLRANAKRTTKV